MNCRESPETFAAPQVTQFPPWVPCSARRDKKELARNTTAWAPRERVANVGATSDPEFARDGAQYRAWHAASSARPVGRKGGRGRLGTLPARVPGTVLTLALGGVVVVRASS